MMNRKKNLLKSVFFLFVLFSFSYVSLFSEENNDVVASSVQSESVNNDEKLTNASIKKALKKEESDKKKEAKLQKKKDKEALEKSKKDSKKTTSKMNIVEVVSNEGVFQAKTIENLVGNIKLLLKGSVGSFQFYSVNKDSLLQPLLAGYDEFTSSFFSLRVGKKEYKLSNNIGIVIGARKSQDGAQLVYVVPGVARVFLRFECVKSSEEFNENILKITAVVKNRSKRTEYFALKNVLDTFLGEQKGPHFSTAEDISINSEMQYRKFDKMKWIMSRNNKASMQILLYGADITPPEVVSLSNKDLLTLPSWIPSVVRSRTFDSVLSYNNSAVCINWETVRLAPNEEQSFSYYIAVSADDEIPCGEDFIYNLEKKLKKASPVENEKSLKFVEPDKVLEKNIIEPKKVESVIQEEKKDNNIAQENENTTQKPEYIEATQNISSQQEQSGEVPNVRFDVETIGVEKLNYQYIQGLIERINTLEGSDENLDRNELLRLNSELDAILEKLRQM